MQPTSPHKTKILAALLMVCAGFSISQTPQRSRTLTVKGYSGQIPVIQLNGRSYVDIESLARLTNGSLSFQGTQTTLTLDGPSADVDPGPPDQAAKLALSKDFLKAAIDGLTVIREWRAGVVNAIHNNQPVTDDLVAAFRRNVESKLTLASSLASKDSDRDVLPFLNNELSNIQRLSDKYLALQKRTRTYVAPDSIDNEPLDQQVQNCAAGLTAMIAGGQFQDVAACH